MATEDVEPNTGPSESPEPPELAARTPSRAPLGHHLREIAADVWHPRTASGQLRTRGEIVNGLEQREMILGIVLGLLEVAIAFLGYHASRDSSTASVRANATSFLVSGLIGALLMVLGAGLKRRALLGFASFLVGLESLTYQFRIGAVIYLFFGGWLLFRVFQKQKQDRALGVSTSRTAGSRANAARPPGTRTPGGAPKGPRASKRYTPPKRTARRR